MGETSQEGAEPVPDGNGHPGLDAVHPASDARCREPERIEGTDALRLEPGRWTALCDRIAPALDAGPAFDRLSAAYAEKHRAYHNAEHIIECLARFDEAADQAEEPDEVDFALWLHDAIYRTRGGDSEAESAARAKRLLHAGDAVAAAIGRVGAMILATRHGDEAPSPDAALAVAIDLSILGREPERFDRYEQHVRREYRWLPGPLFRSKRRGMLVAFAARTSLSGTEHFRANDEAQARANLAHSIARP